ncbi:hypothetical protein Lal_00000074 [Lupinus albus]|nr:hypothetical protein Lal_00000074 [Lupinus albus]
MVARMNPVTITVPNLIPNNSGILLEFKNERFESVPISIQNGFANAGTIDDGFVLALVAPETSFPLEILALIASFNDMLFCSGATFVVLSGWCCDFFMLCHDLLNSTKGNLLDRELGLMRTRFCYRFLVLGDRTRRRTTVTVTENRCKRFGREIRRSCDQGDLGFCN